MREKADEERENATWTFAADCKVVDAMRQAKEEDDEPAPVGEPRPPRVLSAESKPSGNLDAVRTMTAMEEFTGRAASLGEGVLTLSWPPSREWPDGREEVHRRAALDQVRGPL